MTIQKAREILGKRAEKLSDKEIQNLINMLEFIANKAIDEVVNSAERKIK